MNFPTSRTRLRVTADIEIEGSDDSTPLPPPEDADTVRLSGMVMHARTGTALPGLRIRALADTDSDKAATLGSATSNADGLFRIRFEERPEARERLLALRHVPGSALRLRVETGEGRELFTSRPFRLDRAEMEIAVPVPLPEDSVPASDWAALGESLRRSRIGHLSDAVRLLGGEGEISGLEDMPILTRQAMLEQMEEAFLDPTGILRQTAGAVPSFQQLHDPDFADEYRRRLDEHLQDPENRELRTAFGDLTAKAWSFSGLYEVDWPIDPDRLQEGDPGSVGAALNKYAEHYHIYPSVEGIGFAPLDTSDRTRYRDYLREIWVTYATKIVYVQGGNLTPGQALEQLERRFHQSFTTADDSSRNANSVLIKILHHILILPTGKDFGFGVPAASIAPQGTQAPRAYLDYLIGLSGESARELGLRYRMDFTRPDTELSSPVQENIAVLQGFFRDSFQCEAEPYHVDPDKHNQPIIPDKWLGNAPFFLYYDEWLRQQQPFYPENHLDVRRVLPIDVTQQARDSLAALAAGKIPSETANVKTWKFCQDVLAVWDKLQEGHAAYNNSEFRLAQVHYEEAHRLAHLAMSSGVLQGNVPTAKFSFRKNVPLKSMKDLPRFMNPSELAAGGFIIPTALDWARDHMGIRLAYYALFAIPICRGDAEYAQGDYENAVFHYGQATRLHVGVARASDSGGYRPWYLDSFQMYWRGDKPYSVRLHQRENPKDARYPVEIDDSRYDDYYDTSVYSPIEAFAVQWSRRIPHLAEIRCFRLKQANAMLDWADSLYRLNEPTPMARARELYKGVLWLHGKTPPISPEWPLMGWGMPPIFWHHKENPALLSQTGRSDRGIYQIDHGLNYFGERDDIVPVLRYRPLKESADRMAAMARAAQQDFIQYTERIEAAMVARLQLSSFLQKARLQASIADEQQAIAQHDVKVAQDQVTAVQDAIKAKNDEIAKADSFFSQFGDFASGMVKTVTSLPDDTKSAVGAGVVSEATGKTLVGEGMLGLGAGASVMTGIGIFAVAGYITMSGMADAANKRMGELRTLVDKALPAAQAAVAAREHGVTITRYQKQIAQADIDLAQTLLTFEQNRTLNIHFWHQLAQVARRLLRRYLDLGARMTWLTERALAYEQDRPLRLVRMDYFPARLQGVTGADLMLADLAELEATRIEGMKRTVPVRRTLSLAREFPLPFGQLKKTGRCSFRTEEAFFRSPHPGTSAYRIRAVSGIVQQMELVQPLRGSLINRGVSVSKPEQPGEHVLTRPAESLPLTEFRLDRDMEVFGLPNETLLTFEGSSAETFWELSFPPAANPSGLDGLTDVLLTFDLFAEFAPERYEADLAALPTTLRKWILVSGAQYEPVAITDLAGTVPNVDVVFDIRRVKLPRQELSRKIKNVALIVVTHDALDFTAKLVSAIPAVSATVGFKNGFAISSLQPDPALPPLPGSPLDAFAEMDPEQKFTLAISKPANPGADFSHVTDVVLALEYEASLV